MAGDEPSPTKQLWRNEVNQSKFGALKTIPSRLGKCSVFNSESVNSLHGKNISKRTEGRMVKPPEMVCMHV